LGVLKSRVSVFSGGTGWHASVAPAMSCWHYLHPRDTSNQELHVKKGEKGGEKKGKGAQSSRIIAEIWLRMLLQPGP